MNVAPAAAVRSTMYDNTADGTGYLGVYNNNVNEVFRRTLVGPTEALLLCAFARPSLCAALIQNTVQRYQVLQYTLFLPGIHTLGATSFI